MEQLGHEVRLIAPIYVKSSIKRQKNDVADAESIAEAGLRLTMRMVPVKSSAQQARGTLFCTRELLVGQRTQLINTLRAHLSEHDIVVPKGVEQPRKPRCNYPNPRSGSSRTHARDDGCLPS